MSIIARLGQHPKNRRVVGWTLVALLIILAAVKHWFPRQYINLSTPKIVQLRLLRTIAAHPTAQYFQGRNITRATEVAFSSDGRTLVSTSNDQTTKLWNVATGKLLKVIRHQEEASALALAPDGETLATTSEYFDSGTRKHQPTLHLWDARTGALRWKHKSKEVISYARFSPDGKMIVFLLSQLVELRSTRTGTLIKRMQGQVSGPLAFSPDSRLLAVAEHNNGIDGEKVEVWNVRTGTLVRRIQAPGSFPLALLSAYGHRKEVIALTFLSDSKTLVMASNDISDGRMWVWDTSTGHLLQKLPLATEERDWFAQMAPSPDGKLQAIVSGQVPSRTIVWDTRTRTAKWEASTAYSPNLAFAISSDGRTLASASARGVVNLWRVQ
jgi:WD40 repeat protein